MLYELFLREDYKNPPNPGRARKLDPGDLFLNEILNDDSPTNQNKAAHKTASAKTKELK
jgi:hypothetical protein